MFPKTTPIGGLVGDVPATYNVRHTKMNLYLSEFAVSPDNKPRHTYDAGIDVVLSFCKRHSIHCWRSNVFADYPEIENRIKKADLFVALIDKYWTSSTWKGHEFNFSSGGPSMIDGANGVCISKRIALLVGGLEFPSYLRHDPAPVVVVNNIEELNDALSQAFTA